MVTYQIFKLAARTKLISRTGMYVFIVGTHVICYGPRIFIEDAPAKDTTHNVIKAKIPTQLI